MLLVSKQGKQYCVARKADVMVVLSNHPGEGKIVRIVMAEGRAYTRLTLEEFCDLIFEVRQEIIRHNWQANDVSMSFDSKAVPPDTNSSYHTANMGT